MCFEGLYTMPKGNLSIVGSLWSLRGSKIVSRDTVSDASDMHETSNR